LVAERSENIQTAPQFQEYVVVIDPGHASKGDTLVLCWNGRPALVGSVGWLAKHTVIENETVGPVWGKWRPFAEGHLPPYGNRQDGQVEAAAAPVAQTPSEASPVLDGNGATEPEDGPEGAR